MKELDELLNYHKRMMSIVERLQILESITSPQSTKLSHMPKGGMHIDGIENYIVKKDKLLKLLTKLQDEQFIKWLMFLNTYEDCNLSAMQIEILKDRYYDGYSWKHCLKNMQWRYPKIAWNLNKIQKIHYKIINILKKY